MMELLKGLVKRLKSKAAPKQLEGEISERPAMVYDKVTENLIEITLVYASLRAGHEKLVDIDIDSVIWKQKFVDWANEFENKWSGADWLQHDYLAEIEKFARHKILEYAELDG